ncbi:MAG: pilus assembly protein PilN [Gammaproteobacteria bacterium]|nr:PilN domain-containing protein [Gammaproteobacteria bacterium]NNC97936.1 pilus assembly protein PilN [Gammaproteobacteria bacterium]NNM14266.1 pilus assembly protein PilN [Gammaproteobacteria bacterium]
MRKINLLDWRTEKVNQVKKETGIAAGVAAGLGLAVWLLVNRYYVGQIDFQNEKNDHIQSEIRILDRQIEEVKTLEETKKRLIERMEIINRLQKSRPEVVRLFDDMVRIIPDGTFLQSAVQNGRTINFVGQTESSTRVATLMRNIEAAGTLRNADLVGSGIVRRTVGPVKVSEFRLQAQQASPTPEEGSQ